MLDTKGPEIRTGFLKDHKPIQLEKDQILTLSKTFLKISYFYIFFLFFKATDYDFVGNSEKIAISYKSLPQFE